MLTTTVNLNILDSLESSGKVERAYRVGKPFTFLLSLPLRFFANLHRKQMDKHARIIAHQTMELRSFAQAIEKATASREDTDFIDESGALLAHIADRIQRANKLSRDIREIEGLHANLEKRFPISSPKYILTQAIMLSVLDENIRVLGDLSTAVRAHDDDLKVVHDGFAASTPNDALALFDRIAA